MYCIRSAMNEKLVKQVEKKSFLSFCIAFFHFWMVGQWAQALIYTQALMTIISILLPLLHPIIEISTRNLSLQSMERSVKRPPLSFLARHIIITSSCSETSMNISLSKLLYDGHICIFQLKTNVSQHSLMTSQRTPSSTLRVVLKKTFVNQRSTTADDTFKNIVLQAILRLSTS